MKKILFIIPSLGIGGLERLQVTLANKLVQNDYDVTVLTLSPVDDMKDELDKAVHFLYKPPKRHIGNKIPYIRYKYYDDGMWETRASARQLYDYYVGDERYDVEIAFFRGMPVKIVSGSTDCNARHLAWVHTDFISALGYQNNFNSIIEVYEAYKKLDKVVCVSEQAKRGFQQVIGDTGNLTTIYNMVPIKEIREQASITSRRVTKKASFHLVLVARLVDSVKGQKRLIRAVVRLRDEGDDVSLSLIGTGPDREEIKRYIEQNKATDYISMLGELKNPYPYIQEADLLVCSSYYEGYNLTVAEALVLGVPVLSTDCAGPNEILDYGEYGMIVENSEEGLYYGLKQFAENSDLTKEYKVKAMKRQFFFDNDKILRQIIDLF